MLRRMLYSQLRGVVLYGSDGIRAGQVRRVLVDGLTGRPEWVVVSTGALGARQRLVPISAGDLQRGGIHVPYPASTVLTAPRFDPRDTAPSQFSEEELYRHYDMDGTDGTDGIGRESPSALLTGFDRHHRVDSLPSPTVPTLDHYPTPESTGWDPVKLQHLLGLAFTYPQHQPPRPAGGAPLVDAAAPSVQSVDGIDPRTTGGGHVDRGSRRCRDGS